MHGHRASREALLTPDAPGARPADETLADDALAALRTLPGIGPFSAELILIRGAGHPDVFPRHERRLHASIAHEYDVQPAAPEP